MDKKFKCAKCNKVLTPDELQPNNLDIKSINQDDETSIGIGPNYIHKGDCGGEVEEIM
ncbi:MAG: hypothetical protein AAB491_01125 [Patescibacteria group bacterium]